MKLTKSQLKKIIKEEIELLEEGETSPDAPAPSPDAPYSDVAAHRILDKMLDTGTTSRAEILDDILIELGGKESHRIMLMLADSLSKDMGEALVVDPDLRNPRQRIPYGTKTK